jgi:nucleotide-binding universal stress UspA family protein
MVTFKRVLCPVDFSEASRHALDQAIVVARWFEARLTVLHVYSQVFLPVPGLATPSYQSGIPLDAAEIDRLLEQTRAFVTGSTSDLSFIDVKLEAGQPVPHIMDAATGINADLIVIGTHGISGFEHLVLGSVTEKVLRKAAFPVLTVPPRVQATSALPFKKILCSVDFSESSLSAVQTALALAQEADAALDLIHVLDWPAEDAVGWSVETPGGPVFDLEGYRQALARAASSRLEGLVPDSARDWCTPRTRVLHGKPHREILDWASREAIDLIVLGVRGRNVVDLAVFGSTTNQVVRRATCPVLTVRR